MANRKLIPLRELIEPKQVPPTIAAGRYVKLAPLNNSLHRILYNQDWQYVLCRCHDLYVEADTYRTPADLLRAFPDLVICDVHGCPLPQPKLPEHNFHIGDHFIFQPNTPHEVDYVLACPAAETVCLINTRGGSRWSNSQRISHNLKNITGKEVKALIEGGDLSLFHYVTPEEEAGSVPPDTSC